MGIRDRASPMLGLLPANNSWTFFTFLENCPWYRCKSPSLIPLSTASTKTLNGWIPLDSPVLRPITSLTLNGTAWPCFKPNIFFNSLLKSTLKSPNVPDFWGYDLLILSKANS